MNIEELLQELQIPYATQGQSRHVSAEWLGIRCPYCDVGKGNYGLGIHQASGACSCWKCGRHGLFGVLQLASGEAAQRVARLLDVVGYDHKNYVERPAGVYKEPKGVGPLMETHRRYLERRGFDPAEVAETWHVGGIGFQSWLAWRLFIPIESAKSPDPSRPRVSWTTRHVNDRVTLRYVTAPAKGSRMPAKSVLYGANLAGHSIAVCEGPLDAWAVGVGGTATLGVGWTRSQLLEMAKFPYRIVCFDSDAAAQRRAKQLCDELAPFPGTTVRVTLETGKDASRASEAELKELKRMLK